MLRSGVPRLGWRAVLCVAVLGLVPLDPARADGDDVVSNMTAGRIERIMTSFKDVKDFEELENGTYRFEVEGIKIIIFNKGQTMQLYSGFKGKVSLSRINEWNRTKRFSRAYVDDEGEPAIESDIELTGGVTEKNVEEWFKTYIVSLDAFVKHLQE